LAVIWQ